MQLFMYAAAAWPQLLPSLVTCSKSLCSLPAASCTSFVPARLLYEDANLVSAALGNAAGGGMRVLLPASNGTGYPAFYKGVDSSVEQQTISFEVSKSACPCTH